MNIIQSVHRVTAVATATDKSVLQLKEAEREFISTDGWKTDHSYATTRHMGKTVEQQNVRRDAQ